MGFRLVPELVTLNDLERRGAVALILRYFTEFVALEFDCVKMVEDR